MKKLMTGNEAIARGIYEAGARLASAYPGTPSTEILENLKEYPFVYSEWAPNEKVAAEVALGGAVAGVRSVCVMKHVGVNVAADPIFTASYTGINAGFVIVSADDPGLHSSQNEQDNRHYARAAKIPMFEPADSKECLDMMKEAFLISEKFDCPVFLRVTTRICHAKSLVEEGEKLTLEPREYKRDISKYVAVPAIAAKRRLLVLERDKKLVEYANSSPFNNIELKDKKIGVICSGVAAQYAREIFPQETSFLQLGFTYPLAKDLILSFASEIEQIYVVEELDPILEEQIRALGINLIGKDKIPSHYELNPGILRSALFGQEKKVTKIAIDAVPRPPVLCPGCPHRAFFYLAGKMKNTVIAGDIGCYALGAADPLLAMDSCICMGAGFTLAMGMAKAFELQKKDDWHVFGVLGDSTFFHSGITGAIEIIYNKGSVIPVVLDNHTTAMTGQQDNPGSGYLLEDNPAEIISISSLLSACGFKEIIKTAPYDLAEIKAAIQEAIKASEPSALIVEGPCVLHKREQLPEKSCLVDRDLCTSCGLCLQVGCPAIFFKEGISFIEETLCTGCEVCLQVCPFDAIKLKD